MVKIEIDDTNLNLSYVAVFLSMLSITLLITAFILSAKVIHIGMHLATSAAIVLPAWFLLNDVIAEVYGYAFAKKLFWLTMICLLTFAVLANSLINLPSPANWSGDKSYQFVVGKMFFYFLIGFLGFIVSGFTNIYVVSKCKLMIQGRYFWLRSLVASSVGEGLYSVITGSIVFSVAYLSPLPNPSLSSTVNLVFTVYCVKIFYTLSFSWISALLVMVLNKSEGERGSLTNRTGYNPFKSN
jgi:queuosine precursor transporter